MQFMWYNFLQLTIIGAFTMKKKFEMHILVGMVCLAMSFAYAETYYVDGVNGSDSNSGTSADPFKTIQKALDLFNAQFSNGGEVVIRSGTYVLSEENGYSDSLHINGDCIIRSETGNPADVTVDANCSFPCLRVASKIGAMDTTLLVSGITFINGATKPGDSVENGCGVVLKNVGCMLSNCVVRACGSVDSPQTPLINKGSVIDCVIDNIVSRGKTVELNSNAVIKDCVFTGCLATNSTSSVIVSCAEGSELTGCRFLCNTGRTAIVRGEFSRFENCSVVSNYMAGSGSTTCGSVYYLSTNANASCLIRDCFVFANESAYKGAGITVTPGGSASVAGCTVSNNVARSGCGGFIGLDATNGVCAVSGCVFIGNTAASSFGGAYFADGWLVSGCDFIGNTSGSNGGGVGICSATLSDCRIIGNTAAGSGGGVSVGYSIDGKFPANVSATVTCCTVSCNISTAAKGNDAGGGGIWFSSTSGYGYAGGLVDRCFITDNQVKSHGGGVFIRNATTAVPLSIRSSVVAKNTSTEGNGGGLYFVSYAPCSLENCTVATNTLQAGSSGQGRAIYIVWTGAVVTNTVFAGNTVKNGNSYAKPAFVNCCFYQSGGYGGNGVSTGEITSNPLFADFDNGDYSIPANSPCVNQGFSADWMSKARDLGGHRRICGAGVDIGAFEYWFPIGTRFTFR